MNALYYIYAIEHEAYDHCKTHSPHNNLEFDSLAHDKGRLVLLLMSFIYLPHHFQQRQNLWVAISGPLLEVKHSNLQTCRVALRGENTEELERAIE